jgi:hypothetical protein
VASANALQRLVRRGTVGHGLGIGHSRRAVDDRLRPQNGKRQVRGMMIEFQHVAAAGGSTLPTGESRVRIPSSAPRAPAGPFSRRGGRVVRQRPAKPRTAVQFRSPPLRYHGHAGA